MEIKILNIYKEGLLFLYSAMFTYKYQVTLLADRAFKSVDLFKFIDEELKWKYCIRYTKDLGITIDGKNKIKKLNLSKFHYPPNHENIFITLIINYI